MTMTSASDPELTSALNILVGFTAFDNSVWAVNNAIQWKFADGTAALVDAIAADADADIMDPASWTKSPVPVLATSDANKVFGPGHNSFVVDEKGRDLLVYHGRDYREIKGDPLFDPNRHARVQAIRYRKDGTPDFGAPVKNGVLS